MSKAVQIAPDRLICLKGKFAEGIALGSAVAWFCIKQVQNCHQLWWGAIANVNSHYAFYYTI